MTVRDDLPRILLVGGADVGRHDFAGVICGRTVPQAEESLHHWRLDTKYYTADVVLDVRHLASAPAAAAVQQSYEAAVLVFAAARPDTFTSLQQWWGAADAEDLPIRLAVATGCAPPASQLADRPAWLQEAEAWCSERLIELIEVGKANTEEPIAVEGERVGAARVIEALQTHMWPGLQLKPAAGGAAVGPGPDAAAAAGPSGTEKASFQDFLDDDAALKATWHEDDPDLAAMERAFEEVAGAHGNEFLFHGVYASVLCKLSAIVIL